MKKTEKYLLLALLFALSVSVAACIFSFKNETPQVSATEYRFGSGYLLIGEKDPTDTYDRLIFEYKFDSGYDDKVLVVNMANGWSGAYAAHSMKFGPSGYISGPSVVTCESAEDGYIKVTITDDPAKRSSSAINIPVNDLFVYSTSYTTAVGTIRNVQLLKTTVTVSGGDFAAGTPYTDETTPRPYIRINQPVTVVADDPEDGYYFLNWTVGGEVVSSDESYTFTVTGDTALVANYRAYDGTKYADGASYDIKPTAEKNYDYIEFDYKVVSGTVGFAILPSGTDKWSKFYGYFSLTTTGLSSAYSGLTAELGDDKYYHLTIDIASITHYTTELPDAITQNISEIFIKDGNSTGDVYIKNLEFGYYETPMIEGASVRLKEPYGIRFRANVPAKIIGDSGSRVYRTFGMLILPYDYIEDIAGFNASGDIEQQLIDNGKKYKKYSCTPVLENGEYYIQASLTNIKAGNLARNFIGIAFYEKGNTKVYNYNPACKRTIKNVAKAAVNADVTSNGDKKEFLVDTASEYVYDGSDTLSIITDRPAVVGEDVIEFYYKRNTAGSMSFAVIDDNFANGMSNFYGYFSIADGNLQEYSGVQVTPVKDSWEYSSDSTFAIKNGASMWYRVVVDPSVMDKTSGTYATVKGLTSFNKLYFRMSNQAEGLTFEVSCVRVRKKTVEDGAIYLRGKNINPQNLVNKIPPVTLTSASTLTYYFKQLSSKGRYDNIDHMRVYFNRGSNSNYLVFDVLTGSTAAKTDGTANKAYEQSVGYVDHTTFAYVTDENDPYYGWFKVTTDLNSIAHEGNLTNLYSWYTKGEYLIGGFSAS